MPKIAGTIVPFTETQFEVSLGLSGFDVVRVILNSLNGSSWFKLKVTFEMKSGVGEAGGGGETQESFIHGGSEVQTLTLLYIPFLIEKIPLSYSFHRKLYPFHIPTE